MAKIPGWLWLAVGLVMFFVATGVGESLRFFVYVGLGFIIIGAFKMIVPVILGGKDKKEKPAANLNQFQQPKMHQANQQMAAAQHYPKCPRCLGPLYSSFRFCPYCGMQLK